MKQLQCAYHRFACLSLILASLNGYSFRFHAAEKAQPVASVEGISEYQLENGLRVLLFPDTSQPKFTVNITYFVGSRHEGRGEKGMAHLLEHMLFKGTSKHGNLIKLLSARGAQFNGTTWVDRTNYYETLPSDQSGNLEFALALEAERMIHSLIRPEDLTTEFTVVRNEFERGENNPIQMLYQRMMSVAFDWHNYGFSTIGSRSDIERVPAKNLKAFYRNYYQPDNAMLVIAGDFKPDEALKLVEKHFGNIPKPERTLDKTYTVEPPKDGARHVELQRNGDVAATGVLYNVCAGSHQDTVVLDVIGSILTDEPSGRLYKSLVEKGLASFVSPLFFPTREPGAFMVLSEVASGVEPGKVLSIMKKDIETFFTSDISETEVNRAKTRLLKQIELAFKNSNQIGISLTESAAVGDWRLFFLSRDQLEQVTIEDVKRVAKQYFKPSNRTSGIFHPTKETDRTEIPETPDILELVKNYKGRAAISEGEDFEATHENIEHRVRRETVSESIRVALLSKQTRGDSVTGILNFYMGTPETLNKAMNLTASDMVPDLLLRGAMDYSFQDIKDTLDALKANVSMSAGEHGSSLAIQFQTDRAHLVSLIRFIGEILRTPTFPESEFTVLKQQQLTSMKGMLSDPQSLIYRRLRQRLNPYPETSIHHVADLDVMMQRVERLQVKDVKNFYDQFYGTGHARFSIVGDMEEKAVLDALKSSFADWKPDSPFQRISKTRLPVIRADEMIQTPDKKMAVVAAGTSLAMNDTDERYPALLFANYILGGFAESRLFNRLRQKEGLSYGAYSGFNARPLDPIAALSVMAICAPENAAKAQQVLHEELERWLTEPISQEELATAKQSWATSQKNRLANDPVVAGELAGGLYLDRTMLFDKRINDLIQVLEPDDILKALQTAFEPDAFVKLKAGDLQGKP
ncbi:MAG: pitrilysin family protein [Verrucomicrobiota bacterium]|nr:pitrilysin family protein [Verrucomicrobiota bacterium]